MSKSLTISISTLLVFAGLFFACKAYALDIENERPTPMRGVPSAQWVDISDPDAGTRYSYGDPEYTITIRNTAPETLPNMQFLADCAMNSGATIANCYYFTSPTSAKLLNSKVYVNNKMKSVVALLRYQGVNVFGDSFSGSGNYNYWGRNLRQSADGSDSNALWQKTDYDFNPAAQAYWNSGNNAVMAETIERLKQSSKSPVSDVSIFGGSSAFQLLTRPLDGICGYPTSCSDLATHPEGVLWYTDRYTNSGYSLQITRTLGDLYYQNKGTFLIDKGSLLINTPTDRLLSHPDSQKAALGFIVTGGDVVITNNTTGVMTVRTSIFAPNGNIIVRGGSVNLIGSFVAKDFQVTATSVNFIQDTRGEDSWPPGFRELKLPTVSN